MGLYTILPDELHDVDIVVAGGGAAGCVIASRLADADTNCTILLIEAGSDNQDQPAITRPALYKGNFMPDSKSIQIFMPVPEEQLSGRRAMVMAASVLGGGSSINGAIYNRAQRDDFDSWKTPGWSADDLLPYLTKLEKYEGQGDSECHGTSGPINVSSGTYASNDMADDFTSAMNEIGYPTVRDLQDFVMANGVSRSYSFISSQTGRRQDSATTYLHPRLKDGKHPNLHVLVESQIVRILLDEDKRAKAVVYRPNPQHHGDEAAQVRHTVNARKLVVLSAGTHTSPSILERSGVGSSEILKKAGVPLVHHLPGVGHDYQDHQMSVYTYKSNMRPEGTLESLVDGTRDVEQLLLDDDNFLGWNGIDAGAKFRPTESEVGTLSREFRDAWDRDFRNAPTRPLAVMFAVNGILGDPSPFLPGQFFSLACFTSYPYSRGHLHITGPEIGDPLDFRTGYLSDPNDIDLATQVWLYKTQRQVAQNMRFYKGESHLHPQFSPESTAARLTEASMDKAKLPIEYSREDDEAIKKFIRQNVGTTFHSIATCKMAPVEQMGVVDKDLNVHGVQGLKVADLSIAPENVSGNTMSTAVMIGEKSADIIIKEFKLGLA
ncbi:hypothetical protein PV10_06758 [Exophiala mesophila]|uniref:Glucose-methanol-choline oxidoreductase N-terminal domain-containing protein n=1 Tax=Exophiala mesophila TaxID=212818 RepID=A0A0D1XVL9_EXOME|nr:uncharacterized protein PV10_06758 [Exophiala mesophila]KIV92306.1 hypothetical protein PV10_06758 [Exophiala mesophila]